jgi:hypothetical protein
MNLNPQGSCHNGRIRPTLHYKLGVAMLLACAATRAGAQGNGAPGLATHGRKVATAVRTEYPVVVDGRLEAAWEQFPAAADFLQKEPREGEPATERTEFRVLYDATTLYIAVQCFDANPAGIIANERRRDGNLGGDDTVTVVLDTFHDHRNAFLFRTNPLGTQYDAQVTDEGRTVNLTWDERWEVSAQRDAAGWTAEFAVPFKSLRVQESDNGMVWGIEVERVIQRKTESSYWNAYRRGFLLENTSQAGHLNGIENIETGLRLRVKPYLLAGFTQTVRRQPPLEFGERLRTVTKNASDVGIEVMKYRFTPSLTADLTWNTDFAQSDVDDVQVNLERFPQLFPEKREFFQEGAGIFDFGPVGRGVRSNLRLFHSRQIGLSPQRRPVPIIGGGRITGNLQGFTLGLLNVQTEAFPAEKLPASNYGVARLKRNIFSRSFVGAFLLNREIAGSSDFNRVYGMDALFTFYEHLTADAFFARSDEPEHDSKWAYSASAKWDSDSFLLGMDYLSLDPDFRDDIGFVRRTDLQRLLPTIAFRPRPRVSWIRQLEFSGSWDYQMDTRNRLIARVDKYGFQAWFQDGGSFEIYPFVYQLDRVDEPFEISDGVIVPAGDHQWNVVDMSYTFSPRRRISGVIDLGRRYGYYGGNMNKLTFRPLLKVNENFSVETQYEIDDASLPGGDFTQHAVNFRLNYAFNNQWLTSTTLQYDHLDDFFGFHFRLNYIFRPGDDFFLIYTEGRQVDGDHTGEKDRSVQAKLTYSFDF